MSKLFELLRRSHELVVATPEQLLRLYEDIVDLPDVKIRIGHRDGIPREMIEIFIEYTSTPVQNKEK